MQKTAIHESCENAQDAPSDVRYEERHGVVYAIPNNTSRYILDTDGNIVPLVVRRNKSGYNEVVTYCYGPITGIKYIGKNIKIDGNNVNLTEGTAVSVKYFSLKVGDMLYQDLQRQYKLDAQNLAKVQALLEMVKLSNNIDDLYEYARGADPIVGNHLTNPYMVDRGNDIACLAYDNQQFLFIQQRDPAVDVKDAEFNSRVMFFRDMKTGSMIRVSLTDERDQKLLSGDFMLSASVWSNGKWIKRDNDPIIPLSKYYNSRQGSIEMVVWNQTACLRFIMLQYLQDHILQRHRAEQKSYVR